MSEIFRPLVVTSVVMGDLEFLATQCLPNLAYLKVRSTTVSYFDPAAESWTSVGKLTEGRNGVHTATLLKDGRVFIVGGDDITYDRFGRIGGREGLASVRVYDPAEEW